MGLEIAEEYLEQKNSSSKNRIWEFFLEEYIFVEIKPEIIPHVYQGKIHLQLGFCVRLNSLYYLRARYMNPDSGRFWNMDSFEGFNTDPITLHKYLYANANPLTFVDPSGNFSISTLTTAINVSSFVFRALFIPLSKFSLRTIIAAETQTIRLQYARFYLLPTAVAIKNYANSQQLRGEFTNANTLFNVAHSVEQAYLSQLSGAVVGFSASVALGPVGLIYNTLNAGLGVVQVGKDVADNIDSILKTSDLAEEQLEFEITTKGTQRFLLDLLLYRIYPTEYVDVIRDITEGKQNGQSAVVKQNISYLRSLIGRYNVK